MKDKHNKFIVSYKMTKKLLKEAIALDKENYNNSDVGIYDTCLSWLNKNSEIYIVLKLNNALIGYINFAPLKDKAYNLFKTGALKDNQISAEDILCYEPHCSYKCLFMSIVIKEEFRNSNALYFLWSGFLNKVKDLNNRNIKIESIISDCVSPLGTKLAQHLNAKFIKNTKDGQIYEYHF